MPPPPAVYMFRAFYTSLCYSYHLKLNFPSRKLRDISDGFFHAQILQMEMEVHTLCSI